MAKSKKPTKVPAGIYLKGTPGNISVHIHASNGNRLAVLKGYNNRANAQKGILAVARQMEAGWNTTAQCFNVIDLVKARKSVAKKPAKHVSSIR